MKIGFYLCAPKGEDFLRAEEYIVGFLGVAGVDTDVGGGLQKKLYFCRGGYADVDIALRETRRHGFTVDVYEFDVHKTLQLRSPYVKLVRSKPPGHPYTVNRHCQEHGPKSK